MERIVDNIEHVCQLAGNARHAALGTDLDGGFGIEQTPTDIDTIADVIRVADILARRGFSEPDIAGILHANWTRFFQEVLPSS
jgi:membrane dipeptidase